MEMFVSFGVGVEDRAKAVDFYRQGMDELEKGVAAIDDVPEHLRIVDGMWY